MERWIATWAQAHTDIGRITVGRKNSTARICIVNDVTGSALRLRLSNLDGKKAVSVNGATIQIDAGAYLPVTFDTASVCTLLAGQERYSDPIQADIKAWQVLTISIALSGFLSGNNPNEVVLHSKKGNYVQDQQFPLAAKDLNGYLFHMTPAMPALASVEVLTTTSPRTIVCFGDSITQQGQWFNPLREQFRRDGSNTVLLNKGIGGNRLLSGPMFGLSMFGRCALERFRRDVLEEPGVTDLILALGTNDLGNAKDAAALAACGMEKQAGAFLQIATQAQAAGIRVYMTTITPRNGSANWTPEMELERIRCNHWARTADCFDGLIDFDVVTSDPSVPGRMAAYCDSGDHLHPGPLGGRNMAEEAYRVLIRK